MSEYGHVDLETLGKDIEKTIAIADKSERNAAEKREVAGRMLLDAKTRLYEDSEPEGSPCKGTTWENYTKTYCHVKRSQADLLIRIGRGDTTVEEERARSNESSKKAHAKTREAAKQSPLNSSGISQTPNILEESIASADREWDKAYSRLISLIQKQDTATLNRLIKELKNGK